MTNLDLLHITCKTNSEKWWCYMRAHPNSDSSVCIKHLLLSIIKQNENTNIFSCLFHSRAGDYITHSAPLFLTSCSFYRANVSFIVHVNSQLPLADEFPFWLVKFIRFTLTQMINMLTILMLTCCCLPGIVTISQKYLAGDEEIM